MWDAALITLLKVFGNIRSIEKSTHLSVCSGAKKANLKGIQERPLRHALNDS